MVGVCIYLCIILCAEPSGVQSCFICVCATYNPTLFLLVTAHWHCCLAICVSAFRYAFRYEAEPEAQLNPKKKVFEKISPDLKTNADGVAVYKNVPFTTSQGAVTSRLVNASVK